MPLRVSIVTPEREIWAGEADFVRARSAGGDVGVLPSHAPFLGSLGGATVVVQTPDTQKYMAVHGGFIEVLDDRVTLLTGIAELAEEIDLDRARSALRRAEEALETEESAERRAEVVRATTRIRTAQESGLLDIG